jgi:hypothetical protein
VPLVEIPVDLGIVGSHRYPVGGGPDPLRTTRSTT